MLRNYIKGGNLEQVEKIISQLSKDPKFYPEINLDFIIACSQTNKNAYKIFELMLPYVDIKFDDNRPIRLACAGGNFQIIQKLIELGADPSADDNYCIVSASQNGDEKTVEMLLKDPRVDPSVDDNIAIKLASENRYFNTGHLNTVELLLKDPRVDWRKIDSYTDFLKAERNHLKKDLSKNLLSTREALSSMYDQSNPKMRNRLPKEVVKNINYNIPYLELCQKVRYNEIPPMKLVALAQILKIEFNMDISWTDLCGKVKNVLLLTL